MKIEEKDCRARYWLRKKSESAGKYNWISSGLISALPSTTPGSFEEKVRCPGQI